MANEAEIATTNPTSLVAAITDGSNFDFRSLVTVLTARTEAGLKTEAHGLRTAIEGRKGEITRAERDLTSAMEAEVQETIGDVQPVTDFFGRASASASVSIGTNVNLDKGSWTWDVTVKIDSSAVSGYYRDQSISTPDVEVQIEQSSEGVRRYATQLSHLRDTQKRDQQRVLEIRRRLADLPSLERQISAAFVSRQLSESDEGAALLAQLDGVAEQALTAWDPSFDVTALLPGSVDS